MQEKITIPLDRVDEGLNLVASNVRSFIQDHYALMHQKSDWHAVAMAIFALEELVKYSELKRQKELALQRSLKSVEVDRRLFGYGGKSHDYKLKIAKDEKLIPLDSWIINTAKFDSAYFDSAYFDIEDVVRSSALRTLNMYVDWKDGKWHIGTGTFEALRLKNFADSIILTLEKLEAKS